jgi:long-chain acyl-CoA synthetase
MPSGGESGGEEIVRARSVAHLVLDRVASMPGQEAFRHPVPGPDGTEHWESLTWGEAGRRISELAAGLLSLGLRPQDRVALLAATRLDWILADLAINCAGAATTAIYPSSLPDEVRHIVSDSGAVVAIVEDAGKLELVRGLELPDLRTVVTMDESGAAGGDGQLSLAQLAERGRAHLAADPDAVRRAVDQVGPETLATLIYTSGTTGRPKGVRLVHDNWLYEGAAADRLGLVRSDDLQYMWLPLSHSLGKMLLAAQLQIGFATAVDGRTDKIIENLPVVRPTLMVGPPRIYEKMYSRVVTAVAAQGGVKAKLFGWAFGVGRKVSELEQQRRKPGPVLAVQHALADRLVLAKLRDRFGGRIRILISGSAPLSKEVSRWFHAGGLLILEGYGLTETSAAVSVNLPGTFRFGTVGPPLPGSEVRIADDGEVLLRGPGIMRGYHGLPEISAQTVDDDGWLHSGDLGALDDDGLLRITGRKKDLIKTSGGKYVAPQPIETAFPVLCSLASHFVVHGDGRNYCTALVTLDAEALALWARANGVAETDPAELSRHPEVKAIVAAAVKELNSTLARWETIKDFRILDHDLTIEAGELTPSMKLKRPVVESHYKDVLDSMYATLDSKV